MEDGQLTEDDLEPAPIAPSHQERTATGPGDLLRPERPEGAGEARSRSPVLERLSELARRGFLLP